jgi:hypothetical protein
MLALLTSCGNTGNGVVPAAGTYDPYGYGGVYHSDPDWNRPGAPPRVEQPIARPPVAPAPTPMPRMGGGIRR